MSNQLHDLLDNVNSETFMVSAHMQVAPLDNLKMKTMKAGKNAVCFYAGRLSDLTGFKIVKELVRLPYPVCWIEVKMESDASPYLSGSLMWEDNGSICSLTWGKRKGVWSFLSWWELSSEMMFKFHHLPLDDVGSMRAEVTIAPLMFLSALNCNNVKKVEHTPDVKLQRARARRGKKPLFSYWTLALNIPGEKASGSSGEGSHSAPRLHLCRGHIKRRKTGYFWWQPHVRGNKKAGMVHKDYAATYSPPKPGTIQIELSRGSLIDEAGLERLVAERIVPIIRDGLDEPE